MLCTAKESQIRDLLMDSQENNIPDPETVISEDNMHHKSVNETPRANISYQTLTNESMSQMNDQKDFFDDDSLSEILSVKSFKNNKEETIDKYSNSTHHSSSLSTSIQSSSSEKQSCRESSSDTTANKINPYYLIG